VKRSIGIQLREYQSIEHLIEQADELKLTSFQFFLNSIWTKNNTTDFLFFRKNWDRYQSIFVHASYRVNLAHSFKYHPILEHELRILNQCELTNYVIHPGSIMANSSKEIAIERIVATLHTVIKKYPHINIILENTPQRDRLIGADLKDLKIIFELLNYPEKIFFCIDTAHAFSAGYDIASTQGFDEFFSYCKNLFDTHTIALLHLNDTVDECGAGRDQHAYPGKGMLGKETLKKVMKIKEWETIPIILEPPPLMIDTLGHMLAEIQELEEECSERKY
jgi:deoxyribonuclease-4